MSRHENYHNTNINTNENTTDKKDKEKTYNITKKGLIRLGVTALAAGSVVGGAIDHYGGQIADKAVETVDGYFDEQYKTCDEWQKKMYGDEMTPQEAGDAIRFCHNQDKLPDVK